MRAIWAGLLLRLGILVFCSSGSGSFLFGGGLGCFFLFLFLLLAAVFFNEFERRVVFRGVFEFLNRFCALALVVLQAGV